MEGLYFIAAGLFGFAVVIILFAWTRWTDKAQSAERVEMLRDLVEESGAPEFATSQELESADSMISGGPEMYEPLIDELAAAPGAVLDLRSTVVSPVRIVEPARSAPARYEPVPATRPAAATPAPAPAARVPTAPASTPARAPQFVVTVPDAATANGPQVSFGFRRRNAGVALVAALLLWIPGTEARQSKGQGFSFKTSVELINVTATVTDSQGRFVPGLKAEDFEVYEDGKLQTISQFDSDRVPVSLGIALDTSGSMAGEKIAAAQSAVNRFLYDLLGEQDEVFLYRFDSRVELVSGWTEDRRAVGRMLGSIRPNGGTAMYDAVSESVPLAQNGTRRKKALLVISDGNDQNSSTSVEAVRQQIRESEVLVYAIGIDASGASASSYSSGSSGSNGSSSGQVGTPPINPQPSAFPGARKLPPPAPRPSSPPPPSTSSRRGSEGRLNVGALRALTDDSGGRTEIILSPRDLDPATAGIASELSRQYFLGYSTSAPKDGRWHTIEVRVKRGNYTIRARKGFIGS